jgi:hypothetical protein
MWRERMSAQEVADYERIAGPLLRELGYELSAGAAPASAHA